MESKLLPINGVMMMMMMMMPLIRESFDSIFIFLELKFYLNHAPEGLHIQSTRYER